MPPDQDLLAPRDIHLIAIGGTGMAPLACLLKEAGYPVRGSDGPLYPPMSTLLESCGIEPMVGFSAANLDPRPDLVIVGNAVPRTNPEAEAVEAAAIERISMPEALYRFFLANRRPLVVAGTHGKTTTTAMASWVYHSVGHDPGFLIGGIPLNLDRSFALGSGERFLVEGDEYNAAYFDRGPKFFHYRPDTLILTSVEYDHVDLYPTPESLDATYRQLASRMPENGLLVAYGDSEAVRSVANEAPCRRLFYGFEKDNELRAENIVETQNGTRFQLVWTEGEAFDVELPLSGRHNLLNALAVAAVAREDGLEIPAVQAALSTFAGVRRRQEVVGEAGGVTVVDDFAHHPTAVRLTLDGLRERYRGRRLLVALEPRSLTAARSLFFDDYLGALRRADHVWLAPVFHAQRLEPEDRLDIDRLASELSARGVEAGAFGSIDELRRSVLESLEPGDVFVTMSSGSFDGLAATVAASLER